MNAPNKPDDPIVGPLAVGQALAAMKALSDDAEQIHDEVRPALHQPGSGPVQTRNIGRKHLRNT